jgi:hypothetical protein
MDSTSLVIRRLQEDKFSCGRTKCESTVINVLALFAMQHFLRIAKCYILHEFVNIANTSKARMDEWNTKSLTTFERWSEIFEFVRSDVFH